MVRIVIKDTVLRIPDFSLVIKLRSNIAEHLWVCHGPVSKDEHDNWCSLKVPGSNFDEFVVILWWFLVIVGDCELFNHIHVDDSHQSYREKDRKHHAIHETDCYLNDD